MSHDQPSLRVIVDIEVGQHTHAVAQQPFQHFHSTTKQLQHAHTSFEVSVKLRPQRGGVYAQPAQARGMRLMLSCTCRSAVLTQPDALLRRRACW